MCVPVWMEEARHLFANWYIHIHCLSKEVATAVLSQLKILIRQATKPNNTTQQSIAKQNGIVCLGSTPKMESFALAVPLPVI